MENKSISIELPIATWNVVMNALGQRPFLEVNTLIAELKRQADEQLKPTDEN